MIDLNNFQSINLSQFFDSVKVRSGSESRYHLVIVYYKVMFYMLMMLMKFSSVPQHFFRFFFQDQDQDSTGKINNKSYALCLKNTYQIWCHCAKFFFKIKILFKMRIMIWSWFDFGFQGQTYISYIEDTHSESPQTDRQTNRQTKLFFFCSFCLLRRTKHEHSSKVENFFFSHAITIICLFIYSICDEKIEMKAVTVKLLFQSPTKFLNVLWNLKKKN